MAAVYTLHIEAGATCTRQFEYTNEDGTLFDLTGWTALMQIRTAPEAEEVALEVVLDIDIPTAMLSFTISATDTSTLLLPEYVYAMELTNTVSGEVIRLLQGGVHVSAEVVRD